MRGGGVGWWVELGEEEKGGIVAIIYRCCRCMTFGLWDFELWRFGVFELGAFWLSRWLPALKIFPGFFLFL